MINDFVNLYTPGTPKWNDVQEAIDSLGFSSLTNQTAREYLGSRDIDPRWTNEMVEAATRVNYGQVFGMSTLAHYNSG
jgi:prenylcysteine oxidase/farnesylcysteine lyase